MGVAVKVSELPEQLGFDPVVSATLTEGVCVGLMVIVMLLLVAVVGLAQDDDDVITHDTTCPLVNVEVVNVGLLVPAAVPSTFHA